MKLCKIDDLVGTEKLARPIMTSNYQELLAIGTILKPEYVEKIKQLGIDEVFIEDKRLEPKQVAILKEDVEDLFKEKVRSVLERHVYNDSSELEELATTADNIITEILDNEEVLTQIYDIMERSADIYEHSISVCSISTLVSLKLKLDRAEVHDLAVASIFHDIGLRYFDFNYSNVNVDEMGNHEKEEYLKHPAYGYSAIEKAGWLSENAKEIIFEHHERLDGSGYPLKKTKFSLSSKILQAAEAFDEMICGIGFRRARVYEAVEYLKISSRVKFDEEVVAALLEFTAVYPAGTICMLNTGELGVVISQNKGFPERPVLRLVKNKDGEPITEEITCDLIEVHNVYIEKVIM